MYNVMTVPPVKERIFYCQSDSNSLSPGTVFITSHVSKGGSSELIFTRSVTSQAETRPVGRAHVNAEGKIRIAESGMQRPARQQGLNIQCGVMNAECPCQRPDREGGLI